MSIRLIRHLRQQFVGYVALFLALTMGVAWALEANSVKSIHIVDGQVKASDLAGANTVFGTARNQNGSTQVLFEIPKMGLVLRADGDSDSGDIGVVVRNSRPAGGDEIYLLQSTGDAGIIITPAGGVQPAWQPSVSQFLVVDTNDERKAAVLITCGSQAAEGIEERVWCWGAQSDV